MSNTAFSLVSDLKLNRGLEEFLSPKRVQLLENIIVYGSISKAAKASQISYKSAWAWIEKMNLLASKPLVQRISGGKGGGGTIVTAFAKELVQRFNEIEILHHKHMASLDRSFEDLEQGHLRDFIFSRLKTTVCEYSEHEHRASVRLKLASGEEISAQVPRDFLEVNQLRIGTEVFVLIESEVVSISAYDEKEHVSSRNQLRTQVRDLVVYEDEVLLSLALLSEEVLQAQITTASYNKLEIKKGDTVWAMFKAYNVTLLGGES